MVKEKHKKRYRRIKQAKKAKAQAKKTEHLTVQGRITVTPGGLGFVKPTNEGEDIFIPPAFVGSLMNGDLVEVRIKPQKGPREEGKGPVGKVTRVIEHARETLVGEVISGHKVRPLNKKYAADVKVSGSLCGAKRGDWVEVKLLHSDDIRDTAPQMGAIQKKIGKAGSISSDIDAIIQEYDLPDPYTEEEDKEAAKLKPVEIPRENHIRRFTVTLDPIDAKDFDDALSFKQGRKKNEIEIGVHIADVASFIRPGSYWDKEARLRAFTAYLPSRTLPMLPKTLTRMISLTEGEICCAHTVLITVNKETGEIVNSSRCYSKIKVDKRLNYNEVQDYIDGKQTEPWDEDFAQRIQTLVDLTRKMRQFRYKNEHFLELEMPEVRVLCDEESDTISGLATKIQRESEQLVEECMLAANTEVAKEMIKKRIPGVYRIHPEPSQEKVEEFSQLVFNTSGSYPGDLSTRDKCNRFLKSLPDDEKKPVIMTAFLRSMPRASYLEKPEIHYGLGKEKYSHFTSPIRRYSDTLVHQQLIDLELKNSIKSEQDLQKLCMDISEKEKNNDEAYFSANDRLKLRYLDQLLENGKENFHRAVVAKINSGGMQVDISDIGVFGFVPMDKLEKTYELDRATQTFISKKDKSQIHAGDFVYLHLDQIDFTKGTALFSPAEQPTKKK